MSNKIGTKEERLTRIGGSDFGSVLDCNPYKKRIDLVLEKAGVIVNTFDGNYATKRGTKLEDSVIELFENDIGQKIIDKQKQFERKETEKIMSLVCHVDGMTESGAVFEAKTTDVKSKTWVDGIPEYYKAQLEFNMYLSGVTRSYITVAFCKDEEIVEHKTYPYDKKMTEEEILFHCQMFTADVEKYRKLGVIDSGVVRSENIKSELIDEYELIKNKIDGLKSILSPLEKEKKMIEEKIKKQIGRDRGIENDLYRITLGTRIISPKLEYSINRSTLKVEYK